MSRRARTRTSFLGFTFVLIALPLWWVVHRAEASDSSGSNASPATTPAPAANFTVPEGFKVKLLRAGLSPEAFAAAGVTSNSILGLLQDAADLMNQEPNALSAADAAFASARVSCDALQRKIQSGLASGEDVSTYQAALASLATATATRASLLNAYFTAGIGDLTTLQKNRLTLIRANKGSTSTMGTFPLEFMVVERLETQWVALREALANERTASELPGTLSETAQASLTTWRADEAVVAAKSGLDSNLATVTAAWNTASGN